MILIKTDNMKKETLEEFIESYVNRIDRSEDGLVEQCLKDGAKWQQERMFELMNEYADDVIGGCTLRAKEWFEQFKNK